MQTRNMGRREFIASAGAVAALGAIPSWAGGILVPGYYGKHLRSVADMVSANARYAADSFFFITDLHVTSNYKRSGGLIASLSGDMPVSKVLCGGDLPCAFSKCFSTDRSSLDYALNWYRRAWISAARDWPHWWYAGVVE